MFPAIEQLPEFVCRIDSSKLQPGHRHYNAGLCRWRGRLLLAYRYQTADGFNHLGIAELREDFTVASDRALTFPGTGKPYHLEDPRLVVVNDRLYINFDQIDYTPPWEKCLFVMRLFELNEQLDPVREVPLPFGRNGEKTEKNWIFFESPERTLRCIHSLKPKYTSIDTETGKVDASPGLDRWIYGSISGRTPAVDCGDRYLAIIGGHIPHARRRSLYWIGAIEFSKQWPHRLTGVTPHPLAWASDQSPTILNPQNAAWHPLCIFPAGLLVENGHALVSLGVHDSYVALLRFEREAIRRKMVEPERVGEAPRPKADQGARPIDGIVQVRVTPKINGRPRIISEPGGPYKTGDVFATTAERANALAEQVEVIA